MNRLDMTILYTAFCGLFVAAGPIQAADARVIDASTGKPAVGVWVVGQWQTGGGFVQAGSGCIAVVTRTDERGEFTLSGGLFGPRWPAAAYLFAPGYRVESEPNFGQETKVPFVIVPDASSVMERLDYIDYVVRHTDCGIEFVQAHKKQFLPLYRAAIEEATAIAKKKVERFRAAGLNYWTYLLDMDELAAIRKSKADGAAVMAGPE